MGQAAKPRCVVSGSMRKHLDEMRAAARALEAAGAVVSSPRSFERVGEEGGFVYVEGDDPQESKAQIEARHRRAIKEADFVWLVCPQGYVGLSAGIELGVADGAGVPAFAAERPTEDAATNLVQVELDLDALLARFRPPDDR